MTLLVATIVRGGIAFSADTRATCGEPVVDSARPGAPAIRFDENGCRIVSDTRSKLRAIAGRFAYAFTGAYSPDVEECITAAGRRLEADPPADTAELVRRLLGAVAETPADGSHAHFIAAGYTDGRAHVLGGRVGEREPVEASPPGPDGGAQCGYLISGDHSVAKPLAAGAVIPWNNLTLQDGVDFTRHLIWTTMQQQRFDLRLKPTVGGTIETLVITPSEGARWLARLEVQAVPEGPPPVLDDRRAV